MTTAEAADAAGATATSAAPSSERDGRFVHNARTVYMVWYREIIRFLRSPARIVSGLAQPILFLVVLGAGLNPLVGDSSDGVTYQEFIFPGVLAMSVLFSSLFSAISIVWDREFGFLREMLVAPVSRTGLVLGKAAGGGTVAVMQGIILLVLAPFIGVSLDAFQVLGVFALLLLLAFALVAFGIVLASRMQRMESFQMVMALVVNPMLFLSGALFPLNDLPTWLAFLTRLNPATYGVDAIRRVMIPGAPAVTIFGWPVPIWLDVVIIFTMGVAMLAMSVRSFRKVD